MAPRYLIGVDLGTTSSSLSYFDTLDPGKGVRVLSLSQWSAPGVVSQSKSLASFCYILPKNDYKNDNFRLPQHTHRDPNVPIQEVLGSYAMQQMHVNPERVVHAAKSWLCHPGIDANHKILPWHSDELIGDSRMSPVEASAKFLEHLRENWDMQMGLHESDYCFSKQMLVITVPASFSELSSQLTLEAANRALISKDQVHLLEEPQAAFYFWCFGHDADDLVSVDSDDERMLRAYSKIKKVFGAGAELSKLKKVLVCDIGGGTSDFSLLELSTGQNDSFDVKRIRVSEHILLGGENIDLKIASVLESRIKQTYPEKSLSSRQWQQLLALSRSLKEKALLDEDTKQNHKELTVSISGGGSGLFKSAISVGITPKEIQDQVLNGFFPFCEKDCQVDRKTLGLVEWGLPYVKDSAVSKHLAEFIQDDVLDAILFTGGTLNSKMIRDRLASLIESWQGSKPHILSNPSMDLAVAKGASWFATAMRYGKGQIHSAYPRNLFINVKQEGEKERTVMGLIPRGFEGTDTIEIDGPKIRVLLGQPVSFEVSFTNVVQSYQPGSLHSASAIPGLKALASLQTSFESSLRKPGKKKKAVDEYIEVKVRIGMTSTRLLAIECVPINADATEQASWDLKFNVSENQGASVDSSQVNHLVKVAAFNQETYKQIESKIDEVFGKPQPNGAVLGANKLSRELERISGADKSEWNLTQLRQCWELLKSRETKRSRSESHEIVWLKLSAFCLRPGYGDALDSHRVNDLWPCYQKGMCFPKNKQVQHQWWLMWRRVAGGLKTAAQEQVFDKITPTVRKEGANPELIMLAGALELVSMDRKVKLGDALVRQLLRPRLEHRAQKIWALTRLASRMPLYAGADAVVRPSFVEVWIKELKGSTVDVTHGSEMIHFYLASCRKLDHRELDISNSCRADVLEKLAVANVSEKCVKQLTEFVPVDRKNDQHLYGDSLPSGFFVG